MKKRLIILALVAVSGLVQAVCKNGSCSIKRVAPAVKAQTKSTCKNGSCAVRMTKTIKKVAPKRECGSGLAKKAVKSCVRCYKK